MRICFRISVVIALLVTGAAANATTLKVLSGDEQIQQASVIFRGKVERIDMARDWTTARGPIMSTVRFTPLAVYKGTAANPTSLRFLGGSADGLEMRVEGMPRFEVGKEYVLFVSGAKNRACPVVGWTEGRLDVDRVASSEGAVAVTDTAIDWLRKTPMARGRSVMPAKLGLAQFESNLRERIKQVGGSK